MGSAMCRSGASNYIHDFSKYQVELVGFLRIRLLKGLSLMLTKRCIYPTSSTAKAGQRSAALLR
jgi:hypothetical protein